MKQDVYWFHQATEEVARLAARNSRQATRILIAVRELGNTSRGDVRKLRGSEEWRLRAGDWRVLFLRRPDGLYVTEVSDRQDAYN